MKRFKSILLVALAIFVVGAYIPTPNASAQSSSSSALSIVPKKEYVIDPGDSAEDKLTIRNLDNNESLQLYLRVIDFTFTDDSGTPKLLLDESLDPTTWSLRDYLDVPETMTVGPRASASVDINVKMPANIGAGSYYSAIIYSTSAPDGGNVGLAASGVTLVFADVPGTVSESLTLKKFGAYNSDKRQYQTFAFDEPRTIAYTLENKGNVTEAPVGTINLRSMFGQQYVIQDVNPTKSRALIGQTRTYEACIKLKSAEVDFNGSSTEATTCVSPGLWPGLYTASLDIFYGQNGNNTQEITKTAYFWYLPLWFIIVSLVVILAAAFYIWRTIVWIRGGSFKLGGRPRQRKSRRRR